MKTHTSPKIIFALIATAAIFTLSGCFNLSGTTTGSSTKTIDENSKLYETNAFSIVIPKVWEVIEKDAFTSEVPPETVVVFRNNVKNENFTANVNIVQNNLQQATSSVEYSKLVNNRQKSGLYNYKETKIDTIKVKIGGTDEDTVLLAFEAKKGTDEKVVHYIQTYAVKGNSAFIITGAISPQENDSTVKTVEDMVKSIVLK
jgi:hypothetical protein